jgi:serine/threonine protein kinase
LELTRAGTRCGTPLYMSPEQAAGDTEAIDARSDVYSMGAMLYEILTHENLVWGNDRDDVLKKIRDQEPPPPRKRTPNRRIPGALDSICMRAIQKNPADRYPSLLAFVDDLKAWQQHEPVAAHRYSLWERFVNWEQRNVLLSVCLGSLFLGILLTRVLHILMK